MQMGDDVRRGGRGDEAEIAGAGRGIGGGDPFVLVGVGRAEVELLAAELQRGAVVGAEILTLHA